MELLKEHRKLKVLEGRQNVSSFHVCMILEIIQLDILFLIKLHKNKDSILSYILASPA